MRPLRALAGVLALAVLTTGCDLNILGLGSSDDGPPGEITQLPRALTAAESQLLGASNAFAFDLLGELVEAEPERSQLISPLSVSMALGMALNGADGQTFDDMRSTLRLEGLTEAEINASFEGLMDLLKSLDPRVTFDLGNSVWHREDLTLRPSFLEAVEGPFEARIQGVDFMDPATPGVLNAWVDGRTRGRIPEIVPDPLERPGQVVMYLLNAIYFKGDWRDRFDPAETVDGDFHLPDGSTAPARFMTDRRTADYWHSGTYQAVDLPYGGKAFSMTVIVPSRSRSVGDVLETLGNGGWSSTIEGLAARNDIGIHLPRFTLEWGDSLRAPLESLGMGVAFVECEADFSRLFVDDTGCTYVNQVRHKTFIRVDEEGTEAAAATAVDFFNSGPPELRADRPFIYAIRERLSGTILFLGMMMEAPAG